MIKEFLLSVMNECVELKGVCSIVQRSPVSLRIRTAPPVSVRVRVRVRASFSFS